MDIEKIIKQFMWRIEIDPNHTAHDLQHLFDNLHAKELATAIREGIIGELPKKKTIEDFRMIGLLPSEEERMEKEIEFHTYNSCLDEIIKIVRGE